MVVEPFEHGEGGRAGGEIGDAGRRRSVGAGEHSAVDIESCNRPHHITVDEEQRDTDRQDVGDPAFLAGEYERRSNTQSGPEQATDHHHPLGDEAPGDRLERHPGGRVPEIPVVVEPRVVGVAHGGHAARRLLARSRALATRETRAMTSGRDPRRYSFVPGSAAVPTIVGGEGSFLVTSDGRRILDGAGGAIVANIGHGRAEVADAVAAAMRTVDYVMPLWPTPNRLALRDTLVERWLPPGFEHVFFTSGGSESTDSALRLARAYQVSQGRPDRWKIVGRHPSYHGITLGTISAASHTGRRAGLEPMLLDFPKVPWDDADAVVKVIEQEDPGTIAGFIAEPITGAAGGCLVASDEYWRTVTEVCRAHDILLIADEVMTGYGRTGTTWGHQGVPLEPDVIVGGKGLGGGYVPMGMVATTDRVAEPLAAVGGFMFFTFTGGDAMCAGAKAVLDIIERESLIDRVRQMAPILEQRLRDALGHHPNVVEIRGRGLFWGIEFVEYRDPVTPFPASRKFAADVVARALERGVWVYPAGSGPVRDAVMLGPPFVITESEIDQIVTTLHAAIDDAAAAG